MKKSGLVSKLKAAGLATALSVLPAEEVDSGVSYGGSIAVDINKRVSVGGYVSSTDRAKSFFVRGGLNYILTGRDKGDLQLRVGGGYNFNNRIAPSIDLSITPKSESPFSIGAGLGYSSIKKDKKKLDVNGESGEITDVCMSRGGIWIEDEFGKECRCPEEPEKLRTADGECVEIN